MWLRGNKKQSKNKEFCIIVLVLFWFINCSAREPERGRPRPWGRSACSLRQENPGLQATFRTPPRAANVATGEQKTNQKQRILHELFFYFLFLFIFFYFLFYFIFFFFFFFFWGTLFLRKKHKLYEDFSLLTLYGPNSFFRRFSGHNLR